MLTLTIEAGFATDRDSQRRESTRRAGGVWIVAFGHAHERIDHALKSDVGALERAERDRMRALPMQHATGAIAKHCEQTLIFLAVIAVAIADAQYGEHAVTEQNRH